MVHALRGPQRRARGRETEDAALLRAGRSLGVGRDHRDSRELARHGLSRPTACGARLVTNGPGNDQSPIFISNTRVVFTRDVPPGTNWLKLTPEDHTKRRASSEVMAVNIDGTALENLTQNDVLDGNASWASASQRIFFTSSRGGSQELFSMSADGSDVRRVMDATGIQPSVASDGRQVTYTRLVGDRSAVFVHDLASGRVREVIGGDPPRPPA